MAWKTILAFILTAALLPAVVFASDTNGTILNPANWAWGENFGWINFAPTASSSSYIGLQITDSAVTGYGWSKEMGWINFAPTNGGVFNNCAGNLSGHAWSERLGWLDMSGVSISATGTFVGVAGSATSSARRINFSCANCSVNTDWRQCSLRSGSPVCGNGVIESGEQCDDGNTVSGDGCSSTCQTEHNNGNTSGGGGGGGSGTSDIQPPVITDVVTSTAVTTAAMNWLATDNVSVTGCTVSLGLTTDYTAEISASLINLRYSITVPNLSANTQYFYRINCTDAAHNSGVYYGDFHTVIGDTIPPVISSVLTEAGSTDATSTWTATDNTLVSACTYAYDFDAPGAPYAFSAPVAVSGHNYSAHPVSLRPNTRYYFSVACHDDVPNTSATTSEFTTLIDTTPPADVSGLRANPRNASVLLTWAYTTTVSDAASFVIRRSTIAPPNTPNDGTLVTTVTDMSVRQYLDTGLTNDVRYFYSIFVFDTSDNHSNGVSANATPYVAGDRDHDGVPDDLDLCDANNPRQVDTPVGTVVAENGCPKIIIDSSDLMAPIYSVMTYLPGRLTATIPNVIIRTNVATVGLQSNLWYVEDAGYQISFTVAPDGHITWRPGLNHTFSVSYDANGTHLTLHGYRITVDSSGVDPRDTFRVYSWFGSSQYLPDVATLSLLPKAYTISATEIARFDVTEDGRIIWNSNYDELFHFSNNTLTVTGVPVCVRQDTLQSSYRFLSPHGNTTYSTGITLLHILPAWHDFGPGVFSSYNPEIQASIQPQQLRNLNLFMGPVRLYDPTDGESGSVVNLTINLQNVRANIGQCAVGNRVCGNHILELGEQCDDGNTRNGDGCSRFCTVETVSLCGNGIINDTEECDDGNRIDHDGCSAICQIETPVCGNNFVETGEQCDDGNTVDRDGCSAVCHVEILPVCGNAIIETGEQCDDGNTTPRDGCSATCQIETQLHPACSDSMDNDGDGLVDMADTGCTGPEDTSEYNPPNNVPVEPVDSRVHFFLAERTIPTTLIGGVLSSLTGDQITIEMPQALIGAGSNHADLILADSRYHFAYSSATRVDAVNVTMPSPGRYDAVIELYTGSQLARSMHFVVASAPYGSVMSRVDNSPVSGAVVTLLMSDGSLWPANQYRQQNQVAVSVDGQYGFVVPGGQYILQITGDGFVSQQIPIASTNNVINRNITLSKRLEIDALNTVDGFMNGGLSKFLSDAQNLANNVGRQLGAALREVQKFVSDPAVKAYVNNVVAPSVAGIALTVVAPSLANVIYPFLRYLFLQPLLMIGQKKRKEWGVVYNSLTKLPIDLAMVRLVDTVTNRVVQSRVTDFQGRYIFFANLGVYRVEVNKAEYTFPSSILSNTKDDGRLTDLYHGGQLAVEEDGKPVSPNIPLDPIVAEKTPKRIVWERKLRLLQHAVSIIGIIIAAVSVLITPTVMTVVFLAIHVSMYILFQRFVQPRKPKQWGVVSDVKTKKPIDKAIIRLFSSEYGKLISSQVTGGKGRYAFLVGPNTYRISVEHPSYEAEKSDELDLRHTKKGFINRDIALRAKNNGGKKLIVMPDVGA